MKRLTDEQLIRLYRYYRPKIQVGTWDLAEIVFDIGDELVLRGITLPEWFS
jgi:hypothetical protein